LSSKTSRLLKPVSMFESPARRRGGEEHARDDGHDQCVQRAHTEAQVERLFVVVCRGGGVPGALVYPERSQQVFNSGAANKNEDQHRRRRSASAAHRRFRM
jgi:hypothetical protein